MALTRLADSLTVIQGSHNGFRVAKLIGPLDEDTVCDLTEALCRPFSDPETWVFDMGGVPFVDNAGIGTLLDLQRRLSAKGGILTLIRCNEAVREAMELTRINAFVPTYAAIEEIPHRAIPDEPATIR